MFTKFREYGNYGWTIEELLWPAALCNRAGHYIFALSFSFFLAFFPRLISAAAEEVWPRLPYFHTWCCLSANFRCRSEVTCCTRLAENTGRKNSKNRHLGTIAQLCPAISSQLRHVSTTGKKLLSSNISSICPHNMVNFGQLTVEIRLGVWGTPANFNRFRVLAALLHGSTALVVSISQTLRR